MITIRKSVPGFAHRVFKTAAGLLLPHLDLLLPRHNNILCVIRPEVGLPFIAAGHNIVGDAGDVWYAQRAAGETPTNTFANLYLSTAAWSPSVGKSTDTDDLASVISGSSKAATGGYPQTDDADADNTGADVDVVSWAFSYSKADFNATGIVSGAIAASGVTSWGAGAGTDPVLTAFSITSFDKTANDTLKVFVNHTMNGV